jgi:hypothetical protein
VIEGEAIIKFCSVFGLTSSPLHLKQAGIQIEFQSDGRRPKTMTFNVSSTFGSQAQARCSCRPRTASTRSTR